MAEQTWVSCELAEEPEGDFRRCRLLSQMTAMARGLVTMDICAVCPLPELVRVLRMVSEADKEPGEIETKRALVDIRPRIYYAELIINQLKAGD